MTDFFALLGEPRRPWLEPDRIHEKFLTLSSEVHPDRVHSLGEAARAAAQNRLAELNAASRALREPKDRLRHLLELESGGVPKEIRQVPAQLMELFMAAGRIFNEADAILADKAGVTSPLLKVRHFERGQPVMERLLRFQEELGGYRGSLLESLKELDRDWTSVARDRNLLLKRAEELYRLFSYFDRWMAQVRERLARLTF